VTNKATRVDLVAGLVQLGLPEHAARDTVDVVWDEIADALRQGEKVVLSGFGTFRVVRRRARRARNPRTGEQVKVPAKRVVTFQASRELKKHLNDGRGEE